MTPVPVFLLALYTKMFNLLSLVFLEMMGIPMDIATGKPGTGTEHFSKWEFLMTHVSLIGKKY